MTPRKIVDFSVTTFPMALIARAKRPQCSVQSRSLPGMDRSVLAEDIGFPVMNLMSDNPGMRAMFDLKSAHVIRGRSIR